MKKIAINVCFGGFSISAKAVKRIAELQGKECYFFETSFSLGETKYKPTSLENCENNFFWSAFTVPNPEEVLKHEKLWGDMTFEERREDSKKYEFINLDVRPENREDPLLIQAIEELGEEANGRCAKLKIVEIPDDVEYEIEEYDGNEHIAEVHQTWS